MNIVEEDKKYRIVSFDEENTENRIYLSGAGMGELISIMNTIKKFIEAHNESQEPKALEEKPETQETTLKADIGEHSCIAEASYVTRCCKVCGKSIDELIKPQDEPKI